MLYYNTVEAKKVPITPPYYGHAVIKLCSYYAVATLATHQGVYTTQPQLNYAHCIISAYGHERGTTRVYKAVSKPTVSWTQSLSLQDGKATTREYAQAHTRYPR